jgi:hypothetical protein
MFCVLQYFSVCYVKHQASATCFLVAVKYGHNSGEVRDVCVCVCLIVFSVARIV